MIMDALAARSDVAARSARLALVTRADSSLHVADNLGADGRKIRKEMDAPLRFPATPAKKPFF